MAQRWKLHDLRHTPFAYIVFIKALRGGSTYFFVKVDFEIAIDQETRACDHTFEGVPDSGCTPVPAGQLRPYLVPIMLNHLNMLKIMLWVLNL